MQFFFFFFFRMAGMDLVMRLLDLFQGGIMRKYEFSFFEREYILNPRAVVSTFVTITLNWLPIYIS
jgi:hypothetical protein